MERVKEVRAEGMGICNSYRWRRGVLWRTSHRECQGPLSQAALFPSTQNKGQIEECEMASGGKAVCAAARGMWASSAGG